MWRLSRSFALPKHRQPNAPTTPEDPPMILDQLKARFQAALADLVSPEQLETCLSLIRPSGDPKFGDYQANFAMAIGKQLGKAPRDFAAQVVQRLDVTGLAEPPEIAGPGFINVRLLDSWLTERLNQAIHNDRLGIALAENPRTVLVDYSAPNVAKPMHVGHIRSTAIGDAICRTLRFLGHNVISDNHIGDWGTQFGMIIYGYRSFVDAAAYDEDPVTELARIYRLVRQLLDYHAALKSIPKAEATIEKQTAALSAARDEAVQNTDKKTRKNLARLESRLKDEAEALDSLRKKVATVDADRTLRELAAAHPDIGQAVLDETAKLHAGDEENLRLWNEFMPPCLEALESVYLRLGVSFDHTLGESYYNNALGPLVDEMLDRGIARQSDGAIAVFLEGHDVPMLIRKKSGGFLYATTDLATIEYRVKTFAVDEILYVVDHRQSLHFELLFAAARRMGHEGLRLRHISFGTVLGEDGRPFKTRQGDAVGLESLLDEAVARALDVVRANEQSKPEQARLPEDASREIAESVGIAALKYADLSQNRESDYVFSYDKMLAMNGNTATYMQYAYARVRSIFRRGEVDIETVRGVEDAAVVIDSPAERALALELLRFGDAIEMSVVDYRPNQLTSYLFDLAGRYSSFFEQCPVLKADTQESRRSRLLLCDLTARTIKQGLELLGIGVVEKM